MVFKRGSKYWIQFNYAGRRCRRPARTTNKEHAKQIEAALRLALPREDADLVGHAIAQARWNVTTRRLMAAAARAILRWGAARDYLMARFFGWASLEMAMRYVHPDDAGMRAAVAAIEAVSRRGVATKMATAGVPVLDTRRLTVAK